MCFSTVAIAAACNCHPTSQQHQSCPERHFCRERNADRSLATPMHCAVLWCFGMRFASVVSYLHESCCAANSLQVVILSSQTNASKPRAKPTRTPFSTDLHRLQRRWLQAQLQDADRAGVKVICTCHHQIGPGDPAFCFVYARQGFDKSCEG